MKQLYKLGKRRCYICQKILNIDEFKPDKHAALGFSYRCKKCAKIYFQKLRNNFGKYPARIKYINKVNFTCQKCGLYKKNYSFFDIDHINRIKRGNKRKGYFYGKKYFTNLQVLCPNCHRIKSIEKLDFL